MTIVDTYDLKVLSKKHLYEDEYKTLLLASTTVPIEYYVISVEERYDCCSSSSEFSIDKFGTLEEALTYQKTKELDYVPPPKVSLRKALKDYIGIRTHCNKHPTVELVRATYKDSPITFCPVCAPNYPIEDDLS